MAGAQRRDQGAGAAVLSLGMERALKSTSLLENLPIAVYACDAQGRVLSFNQRAAALWGRAPRIGDDSELFCGSHKAFQLDGSAIERADNAMAQVLGSGEPIHDRETILERPDGSRVVAMLHIDPIKDEAGELIGAVSCFHDVSAAKRAQDSLNDNERRLRELLNALPAAIYTTDASGRITFYNQAASEMAGREPVLGSDEWCVTWKLFTPDGKPLPHDQCPMAVALKEDRPIRDQEAVAERPDGKRVPFLPFPTPLHDASGKLIGAVNMLVDISERAQAEARQKAMIDELNHRVKNTLTTVQSLAAQTIRGDGVSEEIRAAFEGRLLALSKLHNRLSDEHWERADLQSILQDILAPYREESGRVYFEGPAVDLSPNTAVTLALVMHELATNAAKYGCLSVPTGMLAISWKLLGGETERRVRIAWRESGGPEVRPPTRTGFGSRLLQRSVANELNGSADMSFEPTGVRCSMEIPLSSISA
jgi:PAS domain S-box-containing protein